MTVTFPKVVKAKTGLLWLRNSFWACYAVDGKAKRTRLGTDDLPTARKLRDEFYAALSEQGAIEGPGGRGTARDVTPGSKHYIYKRKPYVVRVGRTVLGEYETEEEAREARNEHLYQ